MRRFGIFGLLILVALASRASAENPPAFVLQWGTAGGVVGSDPGQFWNPAGLCATSSNQIYVIEVQNNRVQKFSSQGVYLDRWPGTTLSDTLPGYFAAPNGIDLDAAGNVYVADTENHRIQKFTAAGG